MQYYTWNPEKNNLLREEHGITFEYVVFHIGAGDAVDIFEHPNQERYPGQRIMVVIEDGFTYLVPFVESKEEVFQKTIIPTRKATKLYVGDSDEET